MRVDPRIVEDTIGRLERHLGAYRQQKAPPIERVSAKRMVMRSQFAAPAGAAPSKVELERILGNNDLLDINYLERGLRAARPVGRIVFVGAGGRERGYATGFLVGPRLLLTNHHVFGQASDAEDAVVEFDYQLDQAGNPRPTERFRFRAQEFFLAIKELDFALVAVDSTPMLNRMTLADFGWLPLYQTLGKINEGEFVSIIQHPGGSPKQLAIRENRLVSIEEAPPVLVYLSDTAPGSSGSPVLNDSWQVVGLHHSGVPKRNGAGQWLGKDGKVLGPNPQEEDVHWIANEGIRLSAIVKAVLANAPAGAWLDDFRDALGRESTEAGPVEDRGGWSGGGTGADGTRTRQTADGMVVTVPLSFRVQWAGGTLAGPAIPSQHAAPARSPYVPADDTADGMDGADEKKELDKDFSNREEKGYREDFLGVKVPLPTLSAKGKKLVSRRTDIGGAKNFILPYYHYSVVMHKERRMCFFAASNYDAAKPNRGLLSRKTLGNDKWDLDPRIPMPEQVRKNEVYDGTEFDLGHIVRREDNYWGDTEEEAKFANWDTFFYTNCTPQHSGFNRSASADGGIWGDLENYVAKQIKAQEGRACQFAGPVFAENDSKPKGHEVMIPKQFWKVIVVLDGEGAAGTLKAFGFLLSQAQLIKDMEADFVVEKPFEQYHVPLQTIEKLTEVRFPKVVRDADVKKGAAGPAEHERLSVESLAVTVEVVESVRLLSAGTEIERAVFLAEASQAAYGDGKAARDWALENGFGTPVSFDIGNIQGFWCVAPDAAVLSFRGTSNIRQWILDAKFATSGHPWGSVHSGFLGGIAMVENELTRFLKAATSGGSRPVWITGHSLGGALAVLAASRFKEKDGVSASLRTFGQPLVGKKNFAGKFDDELAGRLVRYVNRMDVVPSLPPIPYRHCGDGIRILRGGRLRDEIAGLEAIAGLEVDSESEPLLVPDSPQPMSEENFEAFRKELAREDAAGPQGSVAEERLPGFLVPNIFEHHFMENYVKELRAIRDA